MSRTLLCLTLAVAAATPAATQFVNFDDLNSGGSPYGYEVGDHYWEWGVIFENAYASDYWGSAISPPTACYAEPYCGLNGEPAGSLTVLFLCVGTTDPDPADWVSLTTVWTDAGETVHLKGYDEYGRVVAEDWATAAEGDSTLALGIYAPGRIYSMKVIFGETDDVDAIDDLSYRAYIPEPTCAGLLVLAVLGAAARFGRRR